MEINLHFGKFFDHNDNRRIHFYDDNADLFDKGNISFRMLCPLKIRARLLKDNLSPNSLIIPLQKEKDLWCKLNIKVTEIQRFVEYQEDNLNQFWLDT